MRYADDCNVYVQSKRAAERVSRVSPKALTKMKGRVRAITARTGGRSVVYVATALRKYLTGWKAYFRLAETPRVLADVDKWIHRRLRALSETVETWTHGVS